MARSLKLDVSVGNTLACGRLSVMPPASLHQSALRVSPRCFPMLSNKLVISSAMMSRSSSFLLMPHARVTSSISSHAEIHLLLARSVVALWPPHLSRLIRPTGILHSSLLPARNGPARMGDRHKRASKAVKMTTGIVRDQTPPNEHVRHFTWEPEMVWRLDRSHHSCGAKPAFDWLVPHVQHKCIGSCKCICS